MTPSELVAPRSRDRCLREDTYPTNAGREGTTRAGHAPPILPCWRAQGRLSAIGTWTISTRQRNPSASSAATCHLATGPRGACYDARHHVETALPYSCFPVPCGRPRSLAARTAASDPDRRGLRARGAFSNGDRDATRRRRNGDREPGWPTIGSGIGTRSLPAPSSSSSTRSRRRASGRSTTRRSRRRSPRRLAPSTSHSPWRFRDSCRPPMARRWRSISPAAAGVATPRARSAPRPARPSARSPTRRPAGAAGAVAGAAAPAAAPRLTASR